MSEKEYMKKHLEKITKNENSVAYAIKGIAYLEIIIMFIAGAACSNVTDSYGDASFSAITMISIWAGGAVTGIFIIAIAEIIEILHDIRKKVYKN
jgi:hypothetical protein